MSADTQGDRMSDIERSRRIYVEAQSGVRRAQRSADVEPMALDGDMERSAWSPSRRRNSGGPYRGASLLRDALVKRVADAEGRYARWRSPSALLVHPGGQ
jgi:hypothetical protein